MLQVSYIRDNREQVLERLAVKNFKQTGLVDEILQLDDKRRQTQTSMDNISAEANAAAKQIGDLMRARVRPVCRTRSSSVPWRRASADRS